MKKHLLTALFVSIMSILVAYAHGSEIVVVKSRNVNAYNIALDGFNSVAEAKTSEYVMMDKTGNNEKIIIDVIRAQLPDVIFAIGRDAFLLAQKNTTQIPIVYCMVMYPEKLGIKNDERIITGITMMIPFNKQIDKLRFIMPELKTVGMLYDPKNTEHIVKEATAISAAQGILLLSEKVRSGKNVPKAIRKLIGKIDAFWLIADATVITIDSFEFIHYITTKHNIPIITYSEGLVRNGALYSLSADYFDIGK